MPDAASTILVVEDDTIVRMLIVDVLEELEYTVLEAEDATSALKLVMDSGNRIDLLMTDQGLPDMKGTALAKKVIEAAPGPSGPVRQRLFREHRRSARHALHWQAILHRPVARQGKKHSCLVSTLPLPFPAKTQKTGC